MRVAIVAPWGERSGGAEQVLWTLLREFDPDRIAASVIFLSPGAFVDEVAELGIETTVMPAPRLRNAGAAAMSIRRLAYAFRRSRAEAVLNWSAKTQIYGGPAATLAGLRGRVAWWQHAIPQGHWVDRAATLLPARFVICCSTAAAKAQEQLKPHRRVEIVHAGVEAGEAREPPRAARRTLGVPEARVVVGIVGRLQPWKGQHHVIRAVAVLARRGLDVHCLVVGGSPFELSPEYEPTLRALARDEHIEDRVTFTGQIPDAMRYVSAMDVLVNASEPEPYGLTLLEAMAAGIPTVSIAAGGPLDIVVEGVTGVLIPPRAQDTLADALEPLVRDQSLRASLGEAGRRRALEQFKTRPVAERVGRLLAEIAAS